MDFEGFSTSKFPENRVTSSKHTRSKSFPVKPEQEENIVDHSVETSNRLKLDTSHGNDCNVSEKKPSSSAEIQSSLRQEIMQLERRLHDQVAVRCALEKALGYKSSSQDVNEVTAMPKPATELIRDIAVLELEVGHLEQYLLSLYRKAFDQQVSSLSPPTKDDKLKSPISTPRRRLDFSNSDVILKREKSTSRVDSQSELYPRKENNCMVEDKINESGVHRSHSSLSQRSALSSRASPPEETLGKTLRACHSQPLSMMEYAQNASSNVISLAEHLGTRISDHVPDTPNKLSEDMIKCMCTIYSKLADPPLTNPGLSSPTSSLSSISAFSPKDIWSPGFRNDSSFDVRLDNPFHVEGLKEFSGPYSTMIEVQCVYRDTQKLGDIEPMLQHFRSLISRLEQIDPRKLSHEEKIAFWLNVHNALVMHAFLAYGIPQNNVKRIFLLLKWLRLLLSSKGKFKTGDERQTYAIEHPEPLLHFALSSGNHSDPAVRVYTPKRVHEELEVAKEDYIRATFGVKKDQKIVLPKVVESFAKDSGLCPAGVLEMIQQSLPESLRKSIKKIPQGKGRKNIEWIPHNFAFRYLIMKDLVK
ncbi:uncharacterized protein [Solanum lycopersicum]|uniref:uncharacterized protein isoform X4 n=1 Tax=Solanum lycopersicum TaxID=4081 RepID=UPI000532FD2E